MHRYSRILHSCSQTTTSSSFLFSFLFFFQVSCHKSNQSACSKFWVTWSKPTVFKQDQGKYGHDIIGIIFLNVRPSLLNILSSHLCKDVISDINVKLPSKRLSDSKWKTPDVTATARSKIRQKLLIYWPWQATPTHLQDQPAISFFDSLCLWIVLIILRCVNGWIRSVSNYICSCSI